MLPAVSFLVFQAFVATLAVTPADIAAAPAVQVSSSITGTVQDPDGAVVPGAIVIVRSGTGAEQQTVSGTDGRFTLTAGTWC